MKFGTTLGQVLRIFFEYRAIPNLTFGDFYGHLIGPLRLYLPEPPILLLKPAIELKDSTVRNNLIFI